MLSNKRHVCSASEGKKPLDPTTQPDAEVSTQLRPQLRPVLVCNEISAGSSAARSDGLSVVDFANLYELVVRNEIC